MKMIAWFVAASLLVVAGSSRAQDTKSDSKFFIDVLDKVYGLKTKSIVVTDVKTPPRSPIPTPEVKWEPKTRITITLSFSRDMKTQHELDLLLATFRAGTPYRFDAQPLVFHFFDEDNVCIDKAIISEIEGDVSGLKGEAFRIFLNCRTETFHKAKRIEARYYLSLP